MDIWQYGMRVNHHGLPVTGKASGVDYCKDALCNILNNLKDKMKYSYVYLYAYPINSPSNKRVQFSMQIFEDTTDEEIEEYIDNMFDKYLNKTSKLNNTTISVDDKKPGSKCLHKNKKHHIYVTFDFWTCEDCGEEITLD